MIGAQEKSPTAKHLIQVRGFTVEAKAYFCCPRIEVLTVYLLLLRWRTDEAVEEGHEVGGAKEEEHEGSGDSSGGDLGDSEVRGFEDGEFGPDRGFEAEVGGAWKNGEAVAPPWNVEDKGGLGR
ncbi:hypothetical protein LOK49_LG14G00500 [Camellia lanceoleosa]|uniref:Uncharacterized protein n=1 Tax=Camellia lanceoleosa TaxID=1840588 RepID=A0ACC0FDQ8_9ERIC|nr:hypothetical protein LOK49_LG14G00500 [Camellia lanceoleosa]